MIGFLLNEAKTKEITLHIKAVMGSFASMVLENLDKVSDLLSSGSIIIL